MKRFLSYLLPLVFFVICSLTIFSSPNYVFSQAEAAEFPEDIRQAIAVSNAKSIAEHPALLSNLAFANLVANTNLSQQNALSNQQALNQLGITVTGKTVNRVSDLSPLEALAVAKLDTNNDIDIARQIADLRAVTYKPNTR